MNCSSVNRLVVPDRTRVSTRRKHPRDAPAFIFEASISRPKHELLANEVRSPHTSLTEIDVTMTVAGQVMGTPAYMSPEQTRARRELVAPTPQNADSP